MKIKTIIVDDEQLAIDYLRVELQRHHADVEIVGEFLNPLLAQEFMLTNSIDLLFLDIEMPHINGISFLEKMGYVPFQVVFTTAFSQYALNAFKLKAVDYLLKPIDMADLGAALETVRQKIKTKNLPSRLVISDQNSLELLKLEKIMYCTADKNYTHIFLSDNSKKTISKNLGEFEKSLIPPKFLRIHQSHIVNVDFVVKIQKGDNFDILLENGTVLPISRQRRKEIMDILSSNLD